MHPPSVLLIIALCFLSVANVVYLYAAFRQRVETNRLGLASATEDLLLVQTPGHQVAMEYKPRLLPITSDSLWSQLFPENAGIITRRNRKFIVAMYQQLQCLDEVRVAYLAMHGRPITGRTPDTTATEICLGQLWQIVQCNADITLDPAVLLARNGTLLPGSSGEGVTHRCNDWTGIRDSIDS